MSHADLVASLEALPGRHKAGGGLIARCPSHEDRQPSLSIDFASDGSILLHCMAGCEAEAIVSALGASMADLFESSTTNGTTPVAIRRSRRPATAGDRSFEARYPDGSIAGNHRRTDNGQGDKRIWWDPSGVEVKRLALYRSWEIAEQPDPVVILEGERTAIAATAAGYTAVGTYGSSASPTPEALELLRDRSVVLWPDNDDPGRKHMAEIGAMLDPIAKAVRIVRLPSNAPKGWDAADTDAETVQRLVSQAVPFAEASGPEDHSVPLSAIGTDPPAPMLIDRLDPLGHTILYGTGGVGKGALACYWITRLVREGHRILILDYERHPEEWSRRIASLDRGVHSSELVRHLVPTEPIRKAAAEIAWTCNRHELDYVIVDSAVMACGTDPLKPEAAAEYAAAILAIDRPVLSLAHVTKVDDARYPFGSVFWHNLARMTWSLSGDDGEVLLKHRKHNNYQGLGTFALTVTWSDEGQLREVWEKGYNMTILQRAIDEMPPEGATLAELLTALNDGEHKPVSRETLRRTLAKAMPMRVRLDGDKYANA